jgi:hypothetical protein
MQALSYHPTTVIQLINHVPDTYFASTLRQKRRPTVLAFKNYSKCVRSVPSLAISKAKNLIIIKTEKIIL